jgi:hypothetical protein
VTGLGRSRIVAAAEPARARRVFTEKLLPGRWKEVRGPSPKKLKAREVLAMPIDDAAAKIRRGPPDDDETEDALLDTWAEVEPSRPNSGPRAFAGTPHGDPRVIERLARSSVATRCDARSRRR